jgi:hypothetical protein
MVRNTLSDDFLIINFNCKETILEMGMHTLLLILLVIHIFLSMPMTLFYQYLRTF